MVGYILLEASPVVTQPNRPIKLEISVNASNPAFLEGLQLWLNLELLTPSQVRQLCQRHLTCALPEAIVPEATPLLQGYSNRSAALFIDSPESLVPESLGIDATPVPKRAVQPSWISQRLQSLMAEISVVWLLALGVFMVVVSSGVLAASQWQNFPPVGQYGILFGYTLAFAGASRWATQQSNLQMTARMLQVTTLLIIPVNLWMMDAFQLWNRDWGWIVMAISTCILSGITVVLLKPAIAHSQHARLLLLNSIGLSWLHWGWNGSGVPLMATYVGTIGTAALMVYQYSGHRRLINPTVDKPEADSPPTDLSLVIITIAFALLLLMGRALWSADVTLQQLGLAIGICGWLSIWLSHTVTAPALWQKGGVTLLLLGWLGAVPTVCPWQALVISGLALWLLRDRLYQHWQQRDLNLLFFIGLQSGWLLWRIATALVPHVMALLQFKVVQIAGTTFMPWAAMGVVFLGYVVLVLWFASQLRQQQQPALANHAEELSLALGVGLALLSVPNPTMRVLNLALSTVILAVMTQRRDEQSLIYLTHATGLAAVIAAIARFFPALDLSLWAGVFLIGAIAEWSVSVGETWRRWRRSAWHLGLVLAAIHYALLWGMVPLQLGTAIVMSLPIAIALTWLGSRRQFPEAHLATELSVVALLASQPWLWLFDQPIALPRLVSLGIGTGLMIVNTHQRPRLAMAVPTVGFGLAFTGTAIWHLYGGNLSLDLAINLLAATVATLWVVRSALRRYLLSVLYAMAMDGWAIALCGLCLSILTLHSLAVYSQVLSASVAVVIAIVIVAGAIAYRGWRVPTGWGAYSLSLSLELFLVEILGFTNGSVQYLAIATVALGLLVQLLGDWWQRQANLTHLPNSWHVVPLLYGALAFALRWNTFQDWTGWSTLGIALIAIGIGRRRAEFKPLVYLALVGITVSAYEVLLHALSQQPAAMMGDRWIAMIVLGTAILCAYQILGAWLGSYLKLTKPEIAVFTHLHWGLSSILLGMAVFNGVQSGGLVGLGAGAVLTSYAVQQGRNATPPRLGELWVYAGIVEGTAVTAYAVHTALGDTVFQLLIPWGGAIAAVVSYFFYTLPWPQWGWSLHPWRRAAIVLPLAIALGTASTVSSLSLLLIAGLYIFFAIFNQQMRLTYLSVVLVDWVMLRVLHTYSLGQPLWISAIVSGSLLYVAQVDPGLRAATAKDKRHFLRSVATVLVCFTALYQVGTDFGLGLVAIGLSLGFVLAGLVLRVRAFLYIGTVTFIVQVLRQFWLFVADQSLLLWAMGIALGLLLIWIAGTFEARRSQMVALMQYWLNELHSWE
ncbi:DUF2157 domain-containing protein [Oculatella sp. LEGE 06141]|nr:DUF2157 domain-containing protein [Oculatella sp. LEGE 06141]